MSVQRIDRFETMVCPPNMSLRGVMGRMTATGHLFQVVLDGGGRVLGTVTDGDLRRAILNGVGVESDIAVCMQKNAVIGKLGAQDHNRRLLENLQQISPNAALLPVTDDDGVLNEILLLAGDVVEAPAALVMAGGMGRRLGARTRNTPKPLLPVGGKAILEHILGRLETASITRILISVHYLAEQIEAFVTARSNTAHVDLVREEQPLGTAGAIGEIDDVPGGGLMVLNGDVLTQVDFDALISFHRRSGHDATLAVAQYEVAVPYGVVKHSDDGLFQGIEEKPRMRQFVAAGIYLLSREFCALPQAGQRIDMPELINMGRSIGLKVGLFPIHEYWKDVGQVADLESAERDHNGGPA